MMHHISVVCSIVWRAPDNGGADKKQQATVYNKLTRTTTSSTTISTGSAYKYNISSSYCTLATTSLLSYKLVEV